MMKGKTRNNDFKNLRANLAKTIAGAFSTAVSPFTAVHSSLTSTANDPTKGENTQNDKQDIITAWKANQSNSATGILRGGNQEISEVIAKAKNKTATPEELQYLASKVAGNNKGNLVFSSDGELVNKQTGEVVLGFNDLQQHQGYVDLSKTATNILQFYLTDAEERAHNYTANETIAKGAAKNELTYFNFVSRLAGTSAIDPNPYSSSYLNAGVVYDPTIGEVVLSEVQQNWNEQYNANQMLFQNTHKADRVSSVNKAYDIAFQIDPSKAKGNGHMSGYFQDIKGNWYKFDQGTTAESVSAIGILLNLRYPAGISIHKIDGNVENYLKNDPNTVYIKTTQGQDAKITQQAVQNARNPKDYRICTNNCVDAIQDIFEAGNVKYPLDIDPRPNNYFEKLRKMYPNNNTNDSRKQ